MILLILIITQSCIVYSRIIDCVDNPNSFSKSLWKLNAPTKIGRFNGSEVIGVEGTDNKIAKDIYATATVPNAKNVFLYLEYLNESPRRISIQPSKSSAIELLPGTLADWTSTLQQLALQANNEIKLTMLLKTGQNVYFRKMIISSTTLDSTSAMNNSCNELLGTALNFPSTTSRSVVGASTRKPATRTCPTNDAGVQSCSVCPECACVCNCNCNKEC